ncbi:MAG: hypothetical protein AVDCRST_MAG59-3294 [uncultured Thermomicrobiales bacterium]|uniref:Uncharacterized protein n=1 Tax=uncultured Thermomicrobiales bacterium TaxID=1645740 RepID=A0A6J4V414_9BACT|nr:MAG: hypothetical protein AVDCRST_MAG59-3294 [uncultured Thermomicrobiales bacterium]
MGTRVARVTATQTHAGVLARSRTVGPGRPLGAAALDGTPRVSPNPGAKHLAPETAAAASLRRLLAESERDPSPPLSGPFSLICRVPTGGCTAGPGHRWPG